MNPTDPNNDMFAVLDQLGQAGLFKLQRTRILRVYGDKGLGHMGPEPG